MPLLACEHQQGPGKAEVEAGFAARAIRPDNAPAATRFRGEGEPMTVYILHFERPIGNPSNPRAMAQHYIGWAPDDALIDRIAEHRRGAGAAITRYLHQENIGFVVAAVLPGGRDEERRLKRCKDIPKRRCPICKAARRRRM